MITIKEPAHRRGPVATERQSTQPSPWKGQAANNRQEWLETEGQHETLSLAEQVRRRPKEGQALVLSRAQPADQRRVNITEVNRNSTTAATSVQTDGGAT